ncbi:MAG: ferric reductase-like transmembrane domain-containing protein [Actinobacteria bacterium]|nr:ferric reductase-like transmembrane domain-containing protein [Actinomycetota bacterium]
MNSATTVLPDTWALLRVFGIAATMLFSFATVLGLVGPTLPPAPRLLANSAHRFASVLALSLLLGHIVLAVTDAYVDVGPLSVVVPGASTWQPIGIGLGAVAVDVLLAVALTSAGRNRWPRLWRTVHLATPVAWALLIVHGLVVGTDRTEAWFVALNLGCVLAVGLAGIARLSVRRTQLSQGTPKPLVEAR